MNHIFKILCTINLLCVFQLALGQNRNIKLEYRILSPQPYTEYSSPGEIYIDFLVTNLGPDTLWECDSFRYKTRNSILNGKYEIMRYYRLQEPLYPNDSLKLTDTTYLRWYWDSIGVRRTIDIDLEFAYNGADFFNPICRFPNITYSENIQYYRTLKLFHIAKNTSSIQSARLNNAKVYPNPSTTHKLFIEHPKASEIKHVKIYNTLGQEFPTEINSLEHEKIEVITPSLTSGLYFLSFEINGTVMLEKIIKH